MRQETWPPPGFRFGRRAGTFAQASDRPAHRASGHVAQPPGYCACLERITHEAIVMPGRAERRVRRNFP